MKIGFTIGKFAPLHKGHQYLIEKGLSEMDKFYVIIYETTVTQISIETRANWIKQIYPNAHIIYAKNPPSQYGLDEKSVKIQTDYLKEMVKGIEVTHFYNSEPYGKFVARDLKVEEVQVDRKREKYPISATAIRKKIEENQKFIDKIVMRDLKKA
ncbi:MAG: adenylyltransferase/cytidyltransferase family protein [Clostridia bacterium]|nr:adenylyltransferase/cytidyltransferase family protein [Clostridia bacterium]